jgi:HK97 gp10 family phage protein
MIGMFDGFNVLGLDKIIDSFDALEQNTDDCTKAAVVKGVKIVLKKMKDFCPVKEGILKRSIQGKVLKAKYPGVRLGTVKPNQKKAPHAALVEFGHGGPNPAPPHSYVRRAYDETKNEVENAMVKTYGDFIEEKPFKDFGDLTDILLSE